MNINQAGKARVVNINQAGRARVMNINQDLQNTCREY